MSRRAAKAGTKAQPAEHAPGVECPRVNWSDECGLCNVEGDIHLYWFLNRADGIDVEGHDADKCYMCRQGRELY
ncbi:hypothetical protein GCM10010349_33210 [Streptomyces flavofungini]|nr:hypothetical protein GCM10010349_33210 [Streptomyces flavofungini]